MKKIVLILIITALHQLSFAQSHWERYYDTVFSHYYYSWNPMYDEEGISWPFYWSENVEQFCSYLTNREYHKAKFAPFTFADPNDYYSTIIGVDSSLLGWRHAIERVDLDYPIKIIGMAIDYAFERAREGDRVDTILLYGVSSSGELELLAARPIDIDIRTGTVYSLIYTDRPKAFVNRPEDWHCEPTSWGRGYFYNTFEFYFEKEDYVIVRDSFYMGVTQWYGFWNNSDHEWDRYKSPVNIVPTYVGQDSNLRALQADCPMWDSVQCRFMDFDGNWHYVKRLPRIAMWPIIDTNYTYVGLDKTIQSHGLTLSPNPASNLVEVSADTEISHMLVYDTHGRLVYAQRHNSPRIAINVAPWAKGTYVMKVQFKNSNDYCSQKLVVQ